MIVEKTEVRCQAKHPDPRKRGQVHNALITVAPFAMVFSGRIVKTYEEIRRGYYGARCTCNMISEYEVTEPREQSA